MKAIKFAGVILAMSAVSAMATDGVVTWSVSMPNTMINPAVDSYIEFFVNVDVTGNNQGLATFQNDIRIRKVSTGTNISGHPALSWGEYYKNTMGYKSPATTIRGVIKDDGTSGGPGISALPSLGYTTVDGFIDDVGAGILTWDPLRQSGKLWVGAQQWGVGMASRKSTLLVNPVGDYMVNYGYWSVASFVAANGYGQYIIEILPASAAVLLAEKDLNVPDSGVTQTLDPGDVVAGSITFWVPEPATLLLLAGAGAFIRRRRA